MQAQDLTSAEMNTVGSCSEDNRRMEPSPVMDYVRAADGTTVAHLTIGTGPTVIWLPSLSHVLAQWRIPMFRTAYRQLSESLRLVLYDGRGTGSSDRRVATDDLGIDAHLSDLEAVIAAVGGGPVALLGYYHSVPTAIAFAADHPELVSRLLLFGGAARLRDTMSPAQTQALLSLVDQDWGLFAESAAHAWMGWDAGESGRLFAEAFRTAATPAFARAFFAAAQDIDVTDRLSRVIAPALVLHRQSQLQMPIEVSRALAQSLPNGTLIELAGSFPTLFHEDAPGDLELVIRYLLGEAADPTRSPLRGAHSAGDRLTAREREVLRQVAAGESNAGIASALGISVHTVERHTANLYRKIGARGRADAAAYAVRGGFA
jgi:DNA-binding NarL/FixJ family response regulator